ncbi:7 transmembrane receptor (rhodopsin family) domain-containing protein [Ditylenchus destructor]|nr:7 transmembrane receptor (rhodopsin family) domain-containing protein [Ditylenchus destructor]
MVSGLDPTLLSADSLSRAAVILAVGLLLLFSSIVTIIILLNNETLKDVIGIYLVSLAFADLLFALFIVPLSVYSALSPNWNFLGDDSGICKCTSYLMIVLLSSTIYTYAWIFVDRYAAFMKPTRYEIEHTMTRCKCWITFSWITAILLAMPVIIVSQMEVNYYSEFELCVLDWKSALAYSITLSVLVLVPSVLTVCFTVFSVWSSQRKPEELEDSQRTTIETDENFVVTRFVLVAFVLAWVPIIVVQFLPSYLIHPADSATMKFAFMWLAIGGSSSKLLIYLFTNREFRKSFCSVCTVLYRRHRRRPGYTATAMDENENNGRLANNSTCIPKTSTNVPVVNNSIGIGQSSAYGSFIRSSTAFY